MTQDTAFGPTIRRVSEQLKRRGAGVGAGIGFISPGAGLECVFGGEK